MNVGEASLTTTANHLGTYNEETDCFIITDKSSILTCTVKTDVHSRIIDCSVSNSPFEHSNDQILDCWNYECENECIVVKSNAVHLIKESKAEKHRYQPEKLPILGCCSFEGYVVTVTSTSYTVCNLSDLSTYSHNISEIKKCTSLITGWNMKIAVDGYRSVKQIDVLICDGSKVYHYVGDLVSVIDTGRVLSFCKTEFGYLAAYETNWRLSPMHLFGDQPINLDSLEIPRNHRSSSEARLQLYGWDMELLDDKNLPGHNEPTLLVERRNVVCVSGFYKHVISIFFLKNGTISHKKDISIGLEGRCAGLAFMKNNLLVLRRRFDSDNILLTFPSKSGTVTGDVSLELIKLDEHVGKLMGKKKKHKRNMDKQYGNISDQSTEGMMSYPQFIRDNITEEEIEQKAQQILEEYRSKPPRTGSFSESELSEGTLEILAECKPRHPFIPIPVCDSSEDEESELLMPGQFVLPGHNIQDKSNLIKKVCSDAKDEESELLMPGKLIMPSYMIPSGQNTSNLIKEVCSETTESRNTLPVFMTHDGQNTSSLIKEVRSAAVEAKASPNISEKANQNNCNSNEIPSKFDEKLDKIINLLERQNLLLEMIARQSLVDK